VWIAGYRPQTVKGQPEEVAATERLKGASMVDVAAPSPGNSAFPAAVAVVGAKAYLVGQYQTATQTKPLAEAFLGGRWKLESAAGGGQTSQLYSLGASAKAVVAAGVLNAQGQAGLGTPLVDRLVGSVWHREKVPA
jgi:hypothetical protein